MAIGQTSGDTVIDLSGDIRRRRREGFVKSVFFAAAAISILISLAIVVALIGKAWAFLTSIELSQLWADGWFPRRGRFQLSALLVHTLMVTGIAMLVAVPFGLGSAVYLSEYARSGVRRVLKPTLEILAGIPSVVLGFFALQFITPNIVRGLFPGAQSANFLAAGIAVGILTIPLVASVSEDAMRAVPLSLREASYGLGAKQWHTALRVVFPAAISGIIAAIILGISRAIGET
ncbi:MAG: ABC transporter permease subunit, partial [Acidimicrobiia bacterium]